MMNAIRQNTHHMEVRDIGRVSIPFFRRVGGKVSVSVELNIAMMAISRGNDPIRV